jgi:aspartyl-tRNA(Asn)/glutamyl-tRNA(Gln) amidotransferase subunit C
MSESPRIREDEVRHVARLSRLHLSEAELAQFTGQLGQIIDYVNKLAELDVAEVEPLTTAIDMTNVLRDDAEVAGLTNDQALANAPDQSPPYFKVPKVLDGG